MNNNNKYAFAIENVDLIEENPNSNFAIIELDFFASGNNLHNLYVSENTLFRTSESIKNCPLVWKYSEVLDDIYTHDPDEVPCGFVPETQEIKSKKMPDGRTMLSAVAYIWKRYTGDLLSIFKRDGGKKPVSVEMTVFDIKRLSSGEKELADFKYDGITILGSFVTPAIPSATANVLSFAEIEKEYIEDYKKEFSATGIKLSEEHIEELKKNTKFNEEGNVLTFPYKSIGDINPALKGITPSITLSQANQIAKQADAIGADNGGWGIAIKKFKDTHKVENGKWVLKKSYSETQFIEKPENKEINMGKNINEELENEVLKNTEENLSDATNPTETPALETPITEVDMAEDKKDKKENPEEETPPNEENEEEEEEEEMENKEKDKVFAFPKDLDFTKLEELLKGEEDSTKLAKEELKKRELANPNTILSAMFSTMMEMEKQLSEMKKTNEELSSFKNNIELEQKAFEINKTIKELEEKVVLPAEAREEMLAEADKYEFSNLEAWKTYCKARSFDFAIKDGSESDVERVGLPFGNITTENFNDLWS